MSAAAKARNVSLHPSLASEVRLVVGRLARRVRQETSDGLTPSQLSALASIDRLGPVRLGDLAAAEGVSAPTVTKIVASLEAGGLVHRGDDPSDRRASRLALTASGRATLRRIRSARTAFLEDRIEALSPHQRAVLAEALPILALLADERPVGTP